MTLPARNPAPYLATTLVALLLTACGGGGSGSGSDGSAGGSANQAPSISGVASPTATVGQAYSFQPTASDPEGKKLTFSISGKPGWASFDASTGRLSGTPGASDAGTSSNIVISVSDGTNTVSLAAFVLTVGSAGAGTATVRWIAPSTNEDGSPLTNLAGYRIRYGRSLENPDQSVTISGATVTSHRIGGLTTGTWYFRLSSFTNVGVESKPSAPASKTIQ